MMPIPPLHLILLLFLVSRHTRHLLRSYLALEANWTPKPEKMLDQEELRALYKRACFKVHHKLYRRSWWYYWADDLSFVALCVLLFAVWGQTPPPQQTTTTTLVEKHCPNVTIVTPECDVSKQGVAFCVLNHTTMVECRVADDTDDELCYTRMAWTRSPHKVFIENSHQKNRRRLHFMDEHGERYVAMMAAQSLTVKDGEVLLGQQVIRERTLLQKVTVQQETPDNECVCVAEHGLLEPRCSLLRHNGTWTLLLDGSSSGPHSLEISEDTTLRLSEATREQMDDYNRRLTAAGYADWRVLAHTSKGVERVRLSNSEAARRCFLQCSSKQQHQ
jgi:hypothetical protein